MSATEALERRIDELCRDNEQLRQENQSIGMAAYEVGYKNGSVHYELEHCPACKNIADLQEALDENAKLRGWWTHDGTWHVELPKLPDGIAVTMPDGRDRDVRSARAWRYVRDDNAENAKLRELVHILCYCMHEGTDCDGCKLNDGRGEMGLDALWACDGLHELLRELGIEVNG